jgi:ribosomal-protein-alanine N-acetyltransferase
MKTTKLPTIELSLVTLRSIQKKDFKDFFEFGKDKETTEFLTWGPFKTLKDAKSMLKYIYFKRQQRNEPIGYAIILKENKKMIGTIEYHTFNHKGNSCEIGYVLHKDYWKKGIMSEALQKVTELGFEVLGLDKLVIKHLRENIGSKKVILKNGYKLVAVYEKQHFHTKTGQYHDVFVYERWNK